MIAPTKPFANLTANDLMSRDMVTIPEEMSLREAAALLARAHITGAPVVDGLGRCVGVLSASDFVQWAQNGGRAEPVHCYRPTDVCSDWQMMNLEVLPREEVRRYMTVDPVTASPAALVTELARMMVDAHIHRVFVVDEERRPVGVVSSTDILAAVAYQPSEPALS